MGAARGGAAAGGRHRVQVRGHQAEEEVLLLLQIARDRAGQGPVRTRQPPGGVAQDSQHSGDGWVPGEEAGDVGVRCTVLLMLDYQFKLDPRLARMLGIHTQTRPVIIQALWQYVKTHKLQDPHEREFINCDKYLQQIFETHRMKFSEIPQRLHALLMPPEPIIINHIISVDPNDQKKTACYDIDVEVDDTLKTQMNSFLLSTASQQEIAGLDNKIHETIETINQLKTQREFMLSFARDPQGFINDWLQSQCRDLKTMTDVVGNPEEERMAEFYFQPWAQEAVCRYFYSKVQQRRRELEQALGIRNT
ncbi:hypothetical protein ANANG_G00229680 [Anguilla anguilla]|uniref:DM2 domain-containing protein n=1 Tax=Anguilla anguilla TaxID=7936 RepID=A0A9D3LXY4_ANGAN|nr:hypothetical protein ANANG_G00229680 [Anguilla anguilla]